MNGKESHTTIVYNIITISCILLAVKQGSKGGEKEGERQEYKAEEIITENTGRYVRVRTYDTSP